MTEPRKLSPPWEIIEHRESFEVRTANGLTIAFDYFEDENPTRRFEMGSGRRAFASLAESRERSFRCGSSGNEERHCPEPT